MAVFAYSNIEFNLDLTDPEAESIPLGLFAEWFDGNFWKVGLCARQELSHPEFEILEPFAKEILANPFGLLHETTYQYFKTIGPRQADHILEKYLVKTYPTTLSIQAPSLYQYGMSEDEDPEELFEELCLSIPTPSRKGIWFRMPEQVLTSPAE